MFLKLFRNFNSVSFSKASKILPQKFLKISCSTNFSHHFRITFRRFLIFLNTEISFNFVEIFPKLFPQFRSARFHLLLCSLKRNFHPLSAFFFPSVMVIVFSLPLKAKKGNIFRKNPAE